ncbi:hypothetical protein CONPUDRAFT_60560 [Coniophora puteana RWD-64-598 SS2]|uniref:DUF4218 domain-containing protein n=1 Tax=Coniophora puteana (strain RWD-64-598) TaxID=741705 RepID=A0A5M3MFW0_CONPW|nr:uncharacterized protein CONPUDRAFT_60560 [Coniophora puteana RWD-64-598 SS2]EIW78102.1 hypothetical protein CONPUDRAFT_60560 [Coniophora puteana RWD-64-598 SS2]
MHNLFLGVVHVHFRDIMGIHENEGAGAGDVVPLEPLDVKKMQKCRKILQSNPTHAQLARFCIRELAEVADQRGLVVEGEGGKKPKKKVFIEVLLVRSLKAPSHFFLLHLHLQNKGVPHSLHSLPQLDYTPLEDVLGEELVEEYALPSEDEGVVLRLTRAELAGIWSVIQDVVAPPWCRGPPKNLGCPGHGKLKADQWQSCLEFKLPVALMWTWTHTLPDAITAEHACNYTHHMQAYLRFIAQALPRYSWRPNHHASLHIGEFLLRYGPMHGWWMFPFERLIGILQQVNTNHKIGMLEKMMLETFCTASNAKAFLQQPCCPALLQQCSPVLERCWGLYQGGTLMTDIRTIMSSDSIERSKSQVASGCSIVSPA